MYKFLIFITATKDNIALLILRVVLSIVIFPHGAQKVFGWFGGHGLPMTIDLWSQWWNMSPVVTITVAIIECFGMIFLVLGLFGRVMATSIFAVMIGAVYMVHGQYGFFMNWYSEANRGEGFEFHLLVMAIALAIILKGSGKWSIDQYLQKVFYQRAIRK